MYLAYLKKMKGYFTLSHSLTVVMYGCESWTVKKAEPRRIDAFELWCWRRLLRVPWRSKVARRSTGCKEIQQSILKEISPGISLEGMMLKLKLQYFGHLMQRVQLLCAMTAPVESVSRQPATTVGAPRDLAAASSWCPKIKEL